MGASLQAQHAFQDHYSLFPRCSSSRLGAPKGRDGVRYMSGTHPQSVTQAWAQVPTQLATQSPPEDSAQANQEARPTPACSKASSAPLLSCPGCSASQGAGQGRERKIPRNAHCNAGEAAVAQKLLRRRAGSQVTAASASADFPSVLRWWRAEAQRGRQFPPHFSSGLRGRRGGNPQPASPDSAQIKVARTSPPQNQADSQYVGPSLAGQRVLQNHIQFHLSSHPKS